MDKNFTRDLVKKYRDLFEKLVSDVKDQDQLRLSLSKIIFKSYLVMLLLKCVSIGAAWLLLTAWNPLYGTFFLLFVSLVQTKLILDRDFDGLEDDIIDVVEESGMVVAGNDEEDNLDDDSEKPDEKSSKEDKAD